MRGPVPAALIVLCAVSLPAVSGNRADPARRAALEAKSRAAVAAKPPDRGVATRSLVASQALTAFEQEKKAKGAPRPLLALSPAAVQARRRTRSPSRAGETRATDTSTTAGFRGWGRAPAART